MKQRLLSPEEWHHIRTLRGQKMTGQSAHRTESVPIDPKNPMFVRGTGDTYYWPMGSQPEGPTRDAIARRCPIEAAEAYLAIYERNPPDTWPQGFVQPVRKKPVVDDFDAAKEMHLSGGSFARSIAEAYFNADHPNQTRLRNAFADLFDKYGCMVAEKKETM